MYIGEMTAAELGGNVLSLSRIGGVPSLHIDLPMYVLPESNHGNEMNGKE